MRTGSTWMRAPKSWILIAGCAFLAPLAQVTPTVLDFENLPAGTTVNDQYVRQGVRFSSAFLAADPAARSGTRVLRTVAPTAEVFTPIPLRMAFIKPQARVKLFAMSPGTARNGTLKAFDASGAVIGQDGPKLVAADKFTTMFEVAVSAPRVTRAELQLEGASHYAIDDLEFDTSPKPTTKPVQVIETRQPSARDNAAVSGKFPTEFRIGKPPELSKPSDTEDQAEERFNIESAPAIERDLAPGASAELLARVAGRTGLAGSVRWIGTAAALPVTLSLNGSRVASGKTYALGTNRGGADVGGVAQTAGDVRLSVTNTSKVRVKVSLNLGLVRGQVR